MEEEEEHENDTPVEQQDITENATEEVPEEEPVPTSGLDASVSPVVDDECVDPDAIPIEIKYLDRDASELMYVGPSETGQQFRTRLAALRSTEYTSLFKIFIDEQEVDDDEVIASFQSKYFNQGHEESGHVALSVYVTVEESRALVVGASDETAVIEDDQGGKQFNMKVVVKGDEIEGEEDKEFNVTVVREGSANSKRFMGGYRNKESGVVYHNADAQTAPPEKNNPKGVEKFHRDAQTVDVTNRSQQTNKEAATQMERKDLLLDTSKDRVVEPGEAVPADEVLAAREEQTINIQCFIRQCFAMRRVARLRVEREERQLEEAKSREVEEKQSAEDRKREIERRMKPRSKADFKILEDELHAWREYETRRIKARDDLSNKEKHTLLADLLEKEVKLLQTIDRLKIEARKQNKKEKTQKILNIMAAPKTWIRQQTDSTEAPEVEVDTPMVTRARELVELYHGLCLKDLDRSERLDVIFNVKWVVKDFNTDLANDILSLIDREMDLLNRGRSAKSMEGLRKRLSASFLKFVRCPDYNPEATHFTTQLNLVPAQHLKWQK